ncbi:hypothetical protein HG530_006885 [Fusarium avenaceum]|nr:hypothetical protein HG530_006885 [Fusarium avenaceum]
MVNHLSKSLHAQNSQGEPKFHRARGPCQFHPKVPEVGNVLIRKGIAQIVAIVGEHFCQIDLVPHEDEAAAVRLEQPFVSIPGYAVSKTKSISD